MVAGDKVGQDRPVILAFDLVEVHCRSSAYRALQRHLNNCRLLFESFQRQPGDEWLGSKQVSMNYPPVAMGEVNIQRFT